MSQIPTPGPGPGPNPGTNSTPTPGPASAPTPASVSGDVPIETWRSSLAEAKEAPAAERHELLNSLLGDLDAQVGSL
ncbi:hypothetical protein [Brevibacterium sediminis]|uniref:Uncharacterized protein n=1 Tax=Brevibacterium sediminis TaxID=1857024 RepID=A0A5C4WZR1_9MICO|nr:hypothetical protein [Brevibacterium sediminis]TNM53115.1 hypothetical protein FHQ09_15460 [Brevibacterium sediminis]